MKRFRRHVTIAVTVLLVLVAVQGTHDAVNTIDAQAANTSYPAQHFELETLDRKPLTNGFVEVVHPNGPQVYARQEYQLNGGAPNETYDVASYTAGAPSGRATKPERVARRFLDAYGAYDAERALKYLTKEGIATGSGITGLSWGTREEFRREVSMAKAQREKQTVTGCEEQGESGDGGVMVHCTFDHHEFGSDEVGLGPYTDNYWDLVVRNGKITSVAGARAYITNGSSAQRWEPFQRWVASAHPEDLQTMYPVGELGITKEAIRLWDRRIREWVAAVKAGAA